MCEHLTSGDFLRMTEGLPQDAIVIIVNGQKYYYSRFCDRIFEEVSPCADKDCLVHKQGLCYITVHKLQDVVIEPLDKTVNLGEMYEAVCDRRVEWLNAELNTCRMTNKKLDVEIKKLIYMLRNLRNTYYTKTKDEMDELFKKVKDYLRSQTFVLDDDQDAADIKEFLNILKDEDFFNTVKDFNLEDVEVYDKEN